MAAKMKSYTVDIVDDNPIPATQYDLMHGKFERLDKTSWLGLAVGAKVLGHFKHPLYVKSEVRVTRVEDVPIFHAAKSDGSLDLPTLPYDLQARLRELAWNGTTDDAVLAIKIMELQEVLTQNGIKIPAWEQQEMRNA